MSEKNALDILWIVLCSCLVFIMQAGFLCLESGLTRSKNSINVALKNLTDFGISTVLFWLFGFALMFGRSQDGWIGVSAFAPAIGQDGAGLATFFLFQAMFCGTSVTILSGAVAERIRFAGYLLMAAVVAGVIYPVFGHWVWNGADTGTSGGWLGRLGFVDFAGSSAVHSVGGWVSLAALLRLGARTGRFSADGKAHPMPASNLPLAMLGVFLLWFGWIGFNGGCTLAFNDRTAGVIANTLLAGASGMLLGLGLDWRSQGRIGVDGIINGTLAGLVSITANCHAVTASSALLIGAVGSAITYALDAFLKRRRIDDAVGAVPVHLGAGVWGTLAVALFGRAGELGTGLDRWQQLAVQALGILVCAVWSFGSAWLALKLLDRWRGLRVSAEEEHIGLNVAEHGASSEVHELVTAMQVQARTADWSLRAPVEPFTEVGQIAGHYNSVVEKAESALREITAIQERMHLVIDSAMDAVVSMDSRGLVSGWNRQAQALFGFTESEVLGHPLHEFILPEESRAAHLSGLARYLETGVGPVLGKRVEVTGQHKSGTRIPIELAITPVRSTAGVWFSAFLRDLRERKAGEAERTRLEARVAAGQKLESIGQLAAGIAHEINTPAQFVSDNMRFLQESFAGLTRLLECCRNLDGAQGDVAFERVRGAVAEADLDFLLAEIPSALSESLGGLERVTSIVQAMKQFSHPGSDHRSKIDINEALKSTATVARNEWKYVAKMELDLDPSLPLVSCYPGELNQAVLNMIVNSAHAIADVIAKAPGTLGTIRIGTKHVGERMQITIADTGGGIPESIRHRIFDPFFTTKEVGKGTGQGLAIARSIVVDKHGGTIDVQSEVGVGTTFVIELPIDSEEEARAQVVGVAAA